MPLKSLMLHRLGQINLFYHLRSLEVIRSNIPFPDKRSEIDILI